MQVQTTSFAVALFFPSVGKLEWKGRPEPVGLWIGQQGNRRILFTIPLAPLNPLLFLEMLDAGQDDAVGQC